jgi:hypothetical protein
MRDDHSGEEAAMNDPAGHAARSDEHWRQLVAAETRPLPLVSQTTPPTDGHQVCMLRYYQSLRDALDSGTEPHP